MMLPYMLKYECGFGAGQFPKFNDEVYMIKDEENDEKKYQILITYCRNWSC